MVAKDCGVVPMALLSCCKVYDRAMWLLLCYDIRLVARAFREVSMAFSG